MTISANVTRQWEQLNILQLGHRLCASTCHGKYHKDKRCNKDTWLPTKYVTEPSEDDEESRICEEIGDNYP